MTKTWCAYPEGLCDEADDGRHRQPGPDRACDACGEAPPEGFEAWRASDACSHDYCIEAAGFRRAFEASKRGDISRDDARAVLADREVLRDEFHNDRRLLE
jgi:hypothetical protein